MRILREQLTLAKELNLPVILSERLAFSWLLECMEETAFPWDQVCIVRFRGEPAELRRYLDAGAHFGITSWHFSADGRSFDEIFKERPPLDRVMLMSDAPNWHPAPPEREEPAVPGVAGAVEEEEEEEALNEPCLMPYLCQRVAEAYGLEMNEVAERTTANALQFFGLDRVESEAEVEQGPETEFLEWLE